VSVPDSGGYFLAKFRGIGVHIRFFGNGYLGFCSYSGALLEARQKRFAPLLAASPRLGMARCRSKAELIDLSAQSGGLGIGRFLTVDLGQVWEGACSR